MNFVIRVKRAAGPAAPAVWQEFAYEGHESDSVAAALRELNARTPLTDLEGREAPPVRWECGCACGKCGACAMRVNGLPTLACKAFLGPLGQTVTLEPLSKFPLVADLVVDRGVIFEQLKKIHLWLSGAAVTREKTHELRFQSSRCLMCGCCLEICPNFRAAGGRRRLPHVQSGKRRSPPRRSGETVRRKLLFGLRHVAGLPRHLPRRHPR